MSYEIRKGGFLILDTLPLEAGFKLFEKTRDERIHKGHYFALPGGRELFKALREENKPLRCHRCGWKATHFAIERHKKERLGGWTMNLMGYEPDGSYIARSVDRDPIIRMFTQDHIVPKSLGGTDSLTNLRCMCERCNSKRGNEAPMHELMLSLTHPETYDAEGLITKAYKKFQNTPLNELILFAERFDEEVPKN